MKAIKKIGIIIMVGMVACRNHDNIITPELKPLMEGVYASGYVVSENEYQVIAQAEGYLKEKLVKEGDSITSGTILFKIESEQQHSRNRLAQENYAIAYENYREGSPVLKELKSVVESARSKLAFDSVNFERYNNLLKSNATSKAEFDRMKLVYENSQNEFQAQKSRYEKVRNQVYLEYQNAKSQLQIAQNESGRYLVRSEVSGKVYKLMKEKGELVRRNEVVAILGGDTFYLQLTVDELDIQRVKPKQEVLVKIDAYPGKIFKAYVSQVYPMINQQQQSVRVDAKLAEQLPGNFTGLAVEANIIIQQKDKAIVIPKAALLKGDSVRLKTADGIKVVKVVTGLQTFDEVEIIEGIDENSSVISN
jgi:HlyD family secretion protein